MRTCICFLFFVGAAACSIKAASKRDRQASEGQGMQLEVKAKGCNRDATGMQQGCNRDATGQGMQQEAGKSMRYGMCESGKRRQANQDPCLLQGRPLLAEGRQAGGGRPTDTLTRTAHTHTHTHTLNTHTHTHTDTPMSLWVEQEALSAGGAFLSPQLCH
jgi:hypothetical protein